jgi:hypothetical protein
MEISFYLHDEPAPESSKRVRVARSEYQEFRLTPTTIAKAPEPAVIRQVDNRTTAKTEAPKENEPASESIAARLKQGGAVVQLDGSRIRAVNLSKAADLPALLSLLKEAPELTSLTITTKKFNDAGMAALAGLPKLEELIASNSAVGDEGVKVVKTLPRLRNLYLGATGVTDAGLVHLKDAAQLEVLILSNAKITDKGLAQLAGLTNMKGLFLGGTGVTDAGLEHLKGMSTLTKLNLKNTAVTKEGLARIKKSLPGWIMIEQ